tara:strand:- start:7732 stop:7905 length:174 start_codon:yes stop_codon:yes gene_type:complete
MSDLKIAILGTIALMLFILGIVLMLQFLHFVEPLYLLASFSSIVSCMIIIIKISKEL